MWAARLGYQADDDGGPGGAATTGRAGEEARERTAALDTLLDILAGAARVGLGARGGGVSQRSSTGAARRSARARPMA